MDLNFDINAYMRLNPWDMIIVCISTFLIVLIAKHFFWSKVVAYLDQREAAIQEDIDAGEAKRQAGEAYKEQYEQQLASVKEEAHAILDTAKVHAVQEKKAILSAANQQAEAIKDKAQKDIEREKIAARDEMKAAIADVAFEAAEKLIGKELDEEQHKKYVDDFIEHAGEEPWQE